MHKECMRFFEKVKGLYPNYFKEVKVIDCGSYDINGSVKCLFEDSIYIGVDIRQGKNVIIVSRVQDLKFCNVDVVISAEMLEHSKDYKKDIIKMAEMVRMGGLLAISAAGEGRPVHGMYEGSESVYQNIKEVDFNSIKPYFDYKIEFNEVHKDIYFYGLKIGREDGEND